MSQSGRELAFYPPLPFHTIRVTAGISCTIVTGILIFFCYQLKSDGFKLPWTFLIVLMASVCNLLILSATLLMACCGRFSPLFNILLNIPLLLLWIVAFSILTYNIYGMLRHSCSLAIWAASEGVSVCNTYKILYSFVIFGVLSQFALVVLDVKARRKQVKAGKYDKMNATTDIKLQPTNGSSGLTHAPAVYNHDFEDNRGNLPGWGPGATKDVKYGEVIVEEHPVTTQPHLQHQAQFPDDNHHYYQRGGPPEDVQYASSTPSHYQDPPLSYASPIQQHYHPSAQHSASQYQAHEYSEVHERSRMQSDQQFYDQPSQTAMYDRRGHGYNDERRY